jgi:MYXO-CTERM domain-containing protein
MRTRWLALALFGLLNAACDGSVNGGGEFDLGDGRDVFGTAGGNSLFVVDPPKVCAGGLLGVGAYVCIRGGTDADGKPIHLLAGTGNDSSGWTWKVDELCSPCSTTLGAAVLVAGAVAQCTQHTTTQGSTYWGNATSSFPKANACPTGKVQLHYATGTLTVCGANILLPSIPYDFRCEGTGATCSDKVMNGSETDTDCGGTCSAKCGSGKGCSADSDCATGLTCQPHHEDGLNWKECAAAKPAPTPDPCGNGMDCGGSCTKCADGHACKISADCSASSSCEAIYPGSSTYLCKTAPAAFDCSKCSNGCNASKTACASAPAFDCSTCSNGCNADKTACAQPAAFDCSKCSNGCNADKTACAQPAAFDCSKCSDGCNADKTACAQPAAFDCSKCSDGCNADKTACAQPPAPQNGGGQCPKDRAYENGVLHECWRCGADNYAQVYRDGGWQSWNRTPVDCGACNGWLSNSNGNSQAYLYCRPSGFTVASTNDFLPEGGVGEQVAQGDVAGGCSMGQGASAAPAWTLLLLGLGLFGFLRRRR